MNREKKTASSPVGLLRTAAARFPGGGCSCPGLPKVELVGDRELRIENHRGILAYGTEEIHVSGGAFVIQITGQGLELRAMTGLELLITGRIAGIQLA